MSSILTCKQRQMTRGCLWKQGKVQGCLKPAGREHSIQTSTKKRQFERSCVSGQEIEGEILPLRTANVAEHAYEGVERLDKNRLDSGTKINHFQSHLWYLCFRDEPLCAGGDALGLLLEHLVALSLCIAANADLCCHK